MAFIHVVIKERMSDLVVGKVINILFDLNNFVKGQKRGFSIYK